MRPDVLSLLRCLNCGGVSMRLTVERQDEIEIVEGAVRCAGCGRAYPIRCGILDCLDAPHPWVAAAREAYARAKPGNSITAPDSLAHRAHLDADYRWDTETNYEDLLRRIGSGSGWAVDLGAGTGWTTAGLARAGYRCLAVDISADDKLELARYHFHDGIYFDRVLADMNRLPFVDGASGLVFASAALHHSYDPDGSLREIRRILKDGGRIELINEPVRGLLESFLPGRERATRVPGVFERPYGLTTWLRMLRRAGFSGRPLFPENIRQRLRQDDFHQSHKFNRLAGYFGPLAALLRVQSFKWLMVLLGGWLFGLPFIYSGRTSRDHAV